MRLILIFICLLCSVQSVFSAVEIGVHGRSPILLEDVYQQGGVPYVAVDDILPAVGLSGHWNSIKHIYRIKSVHGWAEISPASGYLKLGEVYYPIKDKPRFIDGRLRVTDSFVQNQLAQLSGRNIIFRDLDPQIDSSPVRDEGTVEKIFSFLLRRKPQKKDDPAIRAVAIDPGHGGLNTGVLTATGVKEKSITLDLSQRLAKQIKMQLGIPVYLSRDGDYDVTLEKRLEAASREGVDVWLLVHAGASFSDQTEGVNLFIRPLETGQTGADDSKTVDHSLLLAEQIATALEQRDIPVNKIYRSSRLSLGQGELPTVLVEVGQMSHSQDLEKLQTTEYQQKLSEAVLSGIRHYATLSKEQ